MDSLVFSKIDFAFACMLLFVYDHLQGRWRHLIGACVALVIGATPASAITIIDVTTTITQNDRVYLTDFCEYVDYIETTTVTRYHGDRPVWYVTNLRLQQDGPGYQPSKNICFDDSIPLKDKPWCGKAIYVSLPQQGGAVYDFILTRIDVSREERYTNECEDCHTPTPEPSTLLLFGVGLVLIGRRIRK